MAEKLIKLRLLKYAGGVYLSGKYFKRITNIPDQDYQRRKVVVKLAFSMSIPSQGRSIQYLCLAISCECNCYYFNKSLFFVVDPPLPNRSLQP